MSGDEWHYYEAHVTIEPVFDGRLMQLRRFASFYQFRVADLLMKKREADTPERSAHDTFCTGRGPKYSELYTRTIEFTAKLLEHGFDVWRVKLESTINDSKYDATFLNQLKERVRSGEYDEDRKEQRI